MHHPRIAIVVPCYNEEAVLPLSLPILTAMIGRMVDQGLCRADSFILCCDDGSTDNTWPLIEAEHRNNAAIKGIRLAHNRGQQATMLAGLMTILDDTDADAAITIDADLQDDPDAIIAMVRNFAEHGDDVVYGVRSGRASDSWFKRTSARAFYNLQQAMGLETIPEHSEFRLMSRRTLELLAAYGENNLYLRGIVKHIGLQSSIVSYERSPRLAGKTKYSVWKLISTSIDGITSFTARPMRLIFLTGVALLLTDIVVAVWVLLSRFNGVAMSGWASLMLSVWFLGSLVLIALGIIGEYVGKIFVEVKHRPRYAIERRLLD